MIASFLENIGGSEWHACIAPIEGKLKPELQTPSGFIRKLKEDVDHARKASIDELLNHFADSGTENLDSRIDEFTSELRRINDAAQLSLQYDLLGSISNYSDLTNYPNLESVQSVLRSPDTSRVAYQRIAAILFKISNQSLSQGNKSNAGQAGESFTRAILSSVGLIPDQHYREQYKSESGSDTDVAFPNVNDFEDSKLEVLVAVQMSTNDRARLTSSELKKGVVGYVITGNGLKASSKVLKDIGNQIVSSYLDANIKIVCHGEEIKSELNRVAELLNGTSGKDELLIRQKYFSEFALSFEQFAKKMRRFRFND